MDMLVDPLETSDGDPKVMMEEIHIKGQTIDSDDDGNVEQLSPQTLLETPDQELQYSIRSPEGGMITYRVLQVDDATAEVATSPTSYVNPATVPQVLTSNINGQLYVISNPTGMFASQTGTRAIAPRSSMMETNNTVVTSIKKRDEKRRATHNEVERRRRDKINDRIAKLASLIPDGAGETKGNGHYDGQSKGGILEKACDYILDLNRVQDRYELLIKEHEELQMKYEAVRLKNIELDRENKELKAELKKSSILFVPDNS